jgi:hypothetical protein
MPITTGFFKSLAMWTAALLLLLAAMQLATGSDSAVTDAGAVALSLHFAPRWLTLALVQCAFPAGVAVAARVISTAWQVRWREATQLLAATTTLAVLVFVLAHFVSPAALRKIYVSPATEPSTMALPELRAARDAAVREAWARDGTLQSWLRANQLDWQLKQRYALTLLSPLLAWLGVLAGVWARHVRRPELRNLHLWGIGLFLLVNIYGHLENSYEVIVLHMVGPAFFAAWLVMLVPAALFMGLAWTTGLRLAEAARARSATRPPDRDDRAA